MESKSIKLYEIYFNLIEKPSLLDMIIYKLYKLNDMFIFKNKLNILIYKLEKKKYAGINTDDKLIESVKCDFLIETVNGFNHCTDIHRTKPFDVYELKLDDGKQLLCADNHLVYADINQGNQNWAYVNDLKKGDFVYTDENWKKVKSIKKKNYKMYMTDMSVESLK